jgi:hypothetical protein
MAAEDVAPHYIDTHPEHATDCCRPGYVRVMCWQSSGCLQIREDIVNRSQLLSTLAGARAFDNKSECIYTTNEFLTADVLQVICSWVAQHIEFARLDEAAAVRVAFDRRFPLLNAAGIAAYDAAADDQARASILDCRTDWFRWRPNDAVFQRPGPVQQRLHRDYEEIRSILFASHTLELQPSHWHQAFKAQEIARLTSEPSAAEQALASMGLPPQTPAEDMCELCCHILGDMILACETPEECEIRFQGFFDAQDMAPRAVRNR